ncbi:hypothetical protein CC86DRAFT_347492 [Ophiobolus disseminans]|uniref:Protein kinase domain-containing protein n=1 Tax=Ophiobolus disseminans TaxID=1469910 RepID=A0A6A7A854_9PLEO|nr:hypothetical protein CC86DRAFT_347492 [Ophiobolus disseminans]
MAMAQIKRSESSSSLPISDSSSDEADHAEIMMDLIYCHMERSVFQKTPSRFLPENVIEEIFTLRHSGTTDVHNAQERVLAILDIETATDSDRMLTDFIVTRARRTFLICFFGGMLNSELVRVMSMFMDHDFDDNSLPIKSEDPWSVRGNHPFEIMEEEMRRHEVTGKNPPKRKARRLWTIVRIEQFTHQQWSFLAPVFSTTSLLHDFGKRTLPFVYDADGARQREGTFGFVRKYTVHHAHFTDGVQQTLPFSRIIAVKEFRNDREDKTSQWENEVRVLEKMNTLHHNHIVRFVTAFRHGEGPDLDHFICFEWADGGNLADMWDGDPQPRLSASLIRAVIQQLHGLAQALSAIHYFKGPSGEGSEESFIHGDIKPKNILWIKDGGEIGTLKLADWGEARMYGANKTHGANTATRHNTTGKYGTRRYEPPEVETGVVIDELGGTKRVRSRLYDTWSFGCFSLEFIIWLLHGMNGLRSFRRDNVGDYGLSDSFYEVNHGRRAKVHGVVSHWMDHLEKDAICQTRTSALGDLLDIVRNGLLVVKLPQGGGSIHAQVKTYPRLILQDFEKPKGTESETKAHGLFTTACSSVDGDDAGVKTVPLIVIDRSALNEEGIPVGYDGGNESLLAHQDNVALSAVDIERFRAIELVNNLNRVAQMEQSDSYWFQDLPRCPIPPNFRERASQVSSKIPSQVRGNYQYPDLDPEDWRTSVDNEFAAKTFERLANGLQSSPSRPPKVTEHLCERCQDFRKNLWSPFFSITYGTHLLSHNAVFRSCDLCTLLWQVCQDNASTRHSSVRFERRESTVKISDGRHPVLSLFRDYDARSVVTDIQTGLSELPGAGTPFHVEILRSWLDHCDSKHWKDPRCKPSRFKRSAAGSIIKLPTRLIAVGTCADNTVRLQEMGGLDDGDWIALSYQWGPPPHFSTTRQNLSEMYAGVEVSKLPQTFRDAISITRALKRPYLWIDSVCIIQGQDGDFEDEATTMEDVYSGAYCVLAACCAENQRSGFLSPRVFRHQVTLDSQHQDYGAIHVCQTIDNFEQHVLKGNLAERGWVLQEHALARRTIFFTKYQTYWECGHGIRCETMATLANDHASLLGDPDFPKRLEPAEHGEFVIRLQELLKQYSRLGLSRDYDRSTAIASLQQRLIRVMNLQGEYGTFHSDENPGLLRRSLLWHRSLDVVSMSMITYPKDQDVPSWSWMSCSGPIDYFPLTFYGFDWQPLKSTWSDTRGTGEKTRLSATVQRLDLSAANPFEADVIFDIPTKVDETRVMAVVLGVEKGDTTLRDKKHYILVVISKEAWGHALYARVGAGYVPGRCLVGLPENCSLI